MIGRVDKHSGMPAYLQIINLVKKEILLGRLKEGDQLPPVREMQNLLGVNMNTVIRSLERLSMEGIIDAQHGVGYFIKEGRPVDPVVLEIIRKTVHQLKQESLDLHIAQLLFEEVWKNDPKN